MKDGYMSSLVVDNRGSKNANRVSESIEVEEEVSMRGEESETPKETPNNIGLPFKLNELFCIADILSSALGIGAFTFPYILYEIGVINSLFIFIFVSICVYYSLDLLIRFVVDSNLFSYSATTQTTLGNCWLKIYAISTFLFYMGNIVNLIKVMFNIISSMLNFKDDDDKDNYLIKIPYFFITFAIELLLCLYTNDINKIHIFSIIISIIFIIIVFVVIIKAIIFLSSDNDNKFEYFSFFSLPNSSSGWDCFLTIISKFIVFFYGYIYHNTFPTFLNCLEKVDDENTKKIHNTSFFTIFIIYFLFSFFGLFLINGDNKDKKQLIVNEKDLEENNPLAYIFKCILLLLFTSLIPIRYLVIRDNFTPIIGQNQMSKLIEIIITCICLIIANLVVYFSDFDNLISNIILIFGGCFGVFICFVLPVINYIAINGRTKMRSIIGYVVTGIFVIIGFFSIFYNFKNKDEIIKDKY